MGFIEELIGLVVFIAFLYGLFYKLPKMLFNAYKHNRNTIHTPMELPSSMNGRTEKVDEIDHVYGTDLVVFPTSTNSSQEYYMTGLQFSPKVKNHDFTVKGKPAKRGHYVRNTLLFGLIGNLPTHDKPAKPEKHYNYQTEGAGEGTLYLINKELTARYQVTFYGNSFMSENLKRFLSKNEEARNTHFN